MEVVGWFTKATGIRISPTSPSKRVLDLDINEGELLISSLDDDVQMSFKLSDLMAYLSKKLEEVPPE